MRTYTTDQIAEIGRCHRSSVLRLMKAGKLGPVTKNGHSLVIQAENKDKVVEMVDTGLKKHGYHRNGSVDETKGTITLPSNTPNFLQRSVTSS